MEHKYTVSLNLTIAYSNNKLKLKLIVSKLLLILLLSGISYDSISRINSLELFAFYLLFKKVDFI